MFQVVDALEQIEKDLNNLRNHEASLQHPFLERLYYSDLEKITYELKGDIYSLYHEYDLDY